MMAMITTTLVTAEDLAEIPDDGYRYELIEGVVHRMGPASFRLTNIMAYITIHLGGYVLEHQLGELTVGEGGYILARDPDTVLAPDVAFVRTDRVPDIEEQDHFAALPPDLVIEVVSPSDRLKDVNDKVARYLAAGVPLVWVFHPRNTTVTVHRKGRSALTLHAGDALDGEEIVPGFTLPLDLIF